MLSHRPKVPARPAEVGKSPDQRPWRRGRPRGNGEIVIEEVVMTATMHEPSTAGSARESIAARLLVPAFWGAVSVIAMWLAVLFDGIFGGDMIFASPANGTT